MPLEKKTLALTVGGLLAASTAAWAFPWDIDMVDSYFLRAYEWDMMTLPEQSVSSDDYRGGYDKMTRNSPAVANVQSPLDMNDPDVIAKGKTYYDIYCSTCHGADGKGGAPVANMKAGNRYPIPPAMLAGDAAVTPTRSDAYIFLTVQQGGAIMPSYGSQMADDEIWSVVAYVRTLDNAKYNPPAEQ